MNQLSQNPNQEKRSEISQSLTAIHLSFEQARSLFYGPEIIQDAHQLQQMIQDNNRALPALLAKLLKERFWAFWKNITKKGK